MTRKHFEELAKIAGIISDPFERHCVTRELITLGVSSNPRFDIGRFHAAVEKHHDNNVMAETCQEARA